jgi:hypothetical protein
MDWSGFSWCRAGGSRRDFVQEFEVRRHRVLSRFGLRTTGGGMAVSCFASSLSFARRRARRVIQRSGFSITRQSAEMRAPRSGAGRTRAHSSSIRRARKDFSQTASYPTGLKRARGLLQTVWNTIQAGRSWKGPRQGIVGPCGHSGRRMQYETTARYEADRAACSRSAIK